MMNSTGTSTLHNGPVCMTCGACYVGAHTCNPADLLARAAELVRLAQRAEPSPPVDRTAGCPCRPENGGSGVCGCVMSGPTITCSVNSTTAHRGVSQLAAAVRRGAEAGIAGRAAQAKVKTRRR